MSKRGKIIEYLIENNNFDVIKETDIHTLLVSPTLYLKLWNDLTDFKLSPQVASTKNKEIENEKIALIKNIGDIMMVMKLLIEWYNKSISEEKQVDHVDGFIDDNCEDDDMWQTEETPMPEVNFNSERKLEIYVWGRRKRKVLDVKVDYNFDATVLYGKKAGVNWKLDGRSEEIRLAVMKCVGFNAFMKLIIDTIENKDCKNIGINCTAGRHRSVTCAITLLKYYPKSNIHYLEL